MKAPRQYIARIFEGMLLLSWAALQACGQGTPTSSERGFLEPAAEEVTVSSTDPASAPQDTTLDVAVFGSGFDRGSQVQMALDGVPSDKVRANSTRFANPKKLIANITIAADAVPDRYDVIVTASSGKRGIGIELFEVTPRALAWVDDGAAYAVHSDGHEFFGNLYRDAAACTTVQAVGGTGFTQLRTVTNSVACKALTWNQRRYLTLILDTSFSACRDANGDPCDLDRDPEDADPVTATPLLEKVPVRFIFDEAFAGGTLPTSTPARILVLEVNDDGSTTQEEEWRILYRNRAHVDASNPDRRIIWLESEEALADICQVLVKAAPRKKDVCEHRATVSLPFRVTVEQISSHL